MILAVISAGILAETVKFGRSIFLEEKAIRKYAEAYEKNAEAERIVLNKERIVDARLEAVIRKKNAIRNYTIPLYISIYENIKDIERNGSTFLDVENYKNEIQQISTLDFMKESTKSAFTNKEILFGTLTFGLGNMAIRYSKKMDLSANIQKSYANVRYNEAQTIVSILEAIEQQANRVSNILAILNRLTIQLLSNICDIVNKNGDNPDAYSTYELELLTLGENMVIALIDLVNIPVINKNGVVESSARQLLAEAEKNVHHFESAMNRRISL